MFRNITLIAYFLFFCIGTATIYFAIHIRPTDAPTYKQLIQDSKDLHSQTALEKQPMHQLRKQVQKDIWTSLHNEQTHIVLQSAASNLTTQQKRDKFEAVEILQDLTCSIEGPHSLQIQAQHGSYSISDFQHLQFIGNVQLHGYIEDKESFALAETLHYFPKERKMLLSSEAPSRVLFWQNDLQLAAPQIQIAPDSSTSLITVQGIGDVHFSFDLNEENAIQEFLRCFL